MDQSRVSVSEGLNVIGLDSGAEKGRRRTWRPGYMETEKKGQCLAEALFLH